MRRLAVTLALLSIAILIAVSTYAAPVVPVASLAPLITTTPTRSGIFMPLIQNPPTLTPTATATNTPIPTATPVATPTALPQGVIVLGNHSLFASSSSSYLHIVGEVVNNTGKPVDFVKIPVDVFNGSALVATDYTYTTMDTLPAGTKTCFDILVQKPAAWTGYVFEPVSYSVTTGRLPNLALLSLSSTNSGSSYHIIGQVRNDEAVAVTYVEPIGTLYNAAGTVVDCDFTFVNTTDLNPGQTSAFDMSFFSRDSYTGVASYRVQVDGNLP